MKPITFNQSPITYSMKLLYITLITLLVFSCGDPVVKEDVKIDYFREDVTKLGRAGLLKNVPATKLDSLVEIYKKDSVNGLKELLVASGDLLKLHVSLNGRTLQDVYQKICDTIGMKYPELKCDEVQTSILPSAVGGNDTDWVVVKVRFGQTWYERKLYYFEKWPIDDFVYRIYNRKLADENKTQRLHLVEFTCVNCKDKDDFMGNTDVSRYGFLMLNKTQADSLLTIPNLEMEQEDEFAIYTSAEMTEQLKKFEASGLPDMIGKKWYEEAKQEVMQSSVYMQQDFYDFFDTLFSFTSFDTSNPYNPYEEILNSLSKVSRGDFIPGPVTDEEGNENVRNVQFSFKGDIYKFEAEQRGGYLFPGIIENVNKALSDQKVGGAFYTIATMDEVCMLVYIEDDKFEKVKASGFFTSLEKGPSKELKDRWNTPAL